MDRDPLDMTLRELLEKLQPQQPHAHDWVNVRTSELPWKRLVEAAERGEVLVSRVGRKLMMKRSDLDRWLEAKAIGQPKAPVEPEKPGKVAHLLRRAGY